LKPIEVIRKELSTGNYELTFHALKKVVERKIMFNEIEEAGENAVIIEDYPNDKYSPSCLILGFSKSNKALHILVSRAEVDFTKIITVYEPDEISFKNYIERC